MGIRSTLSHSHRDLSTHDTLLCHHIILHIHLVNFKKDTKKRQLGRQVAVEHTASTHNHTDTEHTGNVNDATGPPKLGSTTAHQYTIVAEQVGKYGT